MKKRIFVLFIAAALVFWGQSAQAQLFYATSDYVAGTVGLITRDGAGNFTVQKNRVVGFGGDAWGYTFFDHNGESRLVMREFQYSGANDIMSVFDFKNWNAPEANTTKWGRNLHGVASDGTYLYLALQDVYQAGYGDISGRIARVRLDNLNGNPDRIYQYSPDDGKPRKPQGVALTEDGYVYALSGAWEINTFSHEQGEVRKFDRDLSLKGTARVGRNPFEMAVYGGRAYVACQGGMLGAGLWGDIWEVNLSDMTSKRVIDFQAQGLPFPTGGASVSIAKDGTAFVIAGGYDPNADWNYKAKLWVTTAANLSNGILGANVHDLEHNAGVAWLACYDEDSEMLWVEAGSGIEAREKNGALIRKFTPYELGGYAYSIGLWSGKKHASPPVEPELPVGTPADVETIQAVEPQTPEDAEAVTGISKDYFETVTRDDGSKAVTLKKDVSASLAKEALNLNSSVEIYDLFVETATVATIGNIGPISIPIEGRALMASRPQDVNVMKILSVENRETDFFTFAGAGDPDYGADGTFTVFGIGNGKGDGIVPESILGSSTYLLVLFVRDGGKFDLDGRPREISDPVKIIGNPYAGNPGGSSGVGPERGCDAGWGAAFPPLIALICLVTRRTRRKHVR
jgi:hypothetical protein